MTREELAAGLDGRERKTELARIANRLAEYEDTGLSPEQCRELQWEVIRLVQDSVKREMEVAKLEAKVEVWAKAEAEGRLAVLPLALGDTVYQIVGSKVFERIVKRIELYSTGDGLFWFGRIIYGEFNELGKTVFLTREEAEAALAARTRQS